MAKTPVLTLMPEEKAALRKAKIPLLKLTQYTSLQLAEITGIPLDRSEYFLSLSQFQSLGSIGPSSAQDLWDLGYRNIEQFINADPCKMYNDLSSIVGHKMDPCVEDVFRCAIAQVKFPGLSEKKKQWWVWSNQRGESDVTLV